MSPGSQKVPKPEIFLCALQTQPTKVSLEMLCPTRNLRQGEDVKTGILIVSYHAMQVKHM